MVPTEAYAEWRDVIEASPDIMYEEILQRFRGGRDVLAADYLKASRDLEVFRRKYFNKTSEFDAIILPTCPVFPSNLERLKADNSCYVSQNLIALRNTLIAHLMGICALTLPKDYSSCGVFIMFPPNMEEKLLRLGKAAELAIRK